MTAFLILATWVGWVAAAAGLGTGLLALLRPHWASRTIWQAGLWLGLGLFLVGSAALQLLIGLGGTSGSTIAAVAIVSGLALGSWVAWRQAHSRVIPLGTIWAWRRLPILALLALLVVGLTAMARLATGEPMDADAGSYRIAAILYAGDDRIIPGLANIHFRFGFNSTLWPFGALVGTGLWEGLGYRVITGVFVTAMIVDVVIRLLLPRVQGARPGDWFMVVAAAFTGGVILTDGGRWIPSPGQDIAFLVVAAVSVAMLADYAYRPLEQRWAGGMAIITAVTAGSIRPLGWVLAVGSLLVVAFFVPRGKTLARNVRWRTLRLPLVFLGVTALVMVARDAVLSGWLLYPMSVLPLPVPWITPSGEGASQGITAYGRAPGIDATIVLSSNDWLAPWIRGFLNSREAFLLRFMILGALLPLIWPAGRRAWRASLQPFLWSVAPSLLLLVVWFITAPDVRFGWAGLLGVVALPGAFILAAGAYPSLATRVVGVLALAAMMATQVLNGRFEPRGGGPVPTSVIFAGVHVNLLLAPPPTPEARTGQLGDGTPVRFPATGGNCYDIYPLCLLPGTGGDIRRLGDDMSDGFGLIDSKR